MIFKLHMWAFPGLGELTHPMWMGIATQVEAENASEAAEKFAQIGWSGMAAIEHEDGSYTHHPLACPISGSWVEVATRAARRMWRLKSHLRASVK